MRTISINRSCGHAESVKPVNAETEKWLREHGGENRCMSCKAEAAATAHDSAIDRRRGIDRECEPLADREEGASSFYESRGIR